ncbi:ComEC/Rec2 family competence protein [Nonomuraea sp. NPDC000554]|uniref:ComEC/Rec2 family competence protein n=1 Tax=Nonomuraea sp. NPDC000554 TaxID=3154259 RepID=UPI0033226198
MTCVLVMGVSTAGGLAMCDFTVRVFTAFRDGASASTTCVEAPDMDGIDPPRSHSWALTLPALAAWATALPLMGCSATTGMAVASIAVVAALTVALATRNRPTPGAGHWRNVTIAVLGCVAAVAATIALRVHAVSTGPVADLAANGASITAQISLTDDPKVRPNKSGHFKQERVVVPATLEIIQVGGTRLALQTPIVVFAGGPQWTTFLPSQRLEVTGRLARPTPGELAAAVLLVRSPPKVLAPPSWPQTVAGSLRAGLRRAADALPPDQRGLLPGLVVGDTSRMDPQVAADLKEAGLSHLNAVSGANLAIVAGATLALARLAGLPLAPRALVAAASMIAFTVVARPSPSVLRALLMGLVAAIALGTGRAKDGVTALSASVLLLLMFDPELARSYGFALSVAATAGILLLAPNWRDRLASTPEGQNTTPPGKTTAHRRSNAVPVRRATPGRPSTALEHFSAAPHGEPGVSAAPQGLGCAVCASGASADGPVGGPTRPPCLVCLSGATSLGRRGAPTASQHPVGSDCFSAAANPEHQSTASPGVGRFSAVPSGETSAGSARLSALGRRRRVRLPRWVAEAVAVPAAAQAAVTPVLLLMSGQLTLVAVPANLLAGPAVAPATLLGFLAALVAPVSPEAAQLLVIPAGYAVGWIIMVAHWAVNVPLATVPWPGGLAGVGLLAVAVGVAVPVLRRRAWRAVALTMAGAALLAVLIVRPIASPWPPRGWLMVVCDVGQGDGLVLAAGPGRAVVVDTGPDPVAMDRCLRRLAIRDVPLLVLSHPHADHVNGLPGVFRDRRVGAAVVSPDHVAPQEAARVSADLSRRRTPEWQATPGTRWRFGPSEITVLAPDPALGEIGGQGEGSVVNNSSVVLLVRWQAGSALLSGDIETEAQDELLRRFSPRADILKVPHHGSPRQDPAFLAAVGARAALISVGAGNGYGHPAPSTLANLHQLGARVYRTDRSGDLAVVARNGGLAVLPRGP